MADIQQQLRALLKRDVPQLRKTNDEPSQISAIDVVRAVSGKGANEAAEAWRRLVEQYPEVKAKSFDFKFPGRGRRNTPVLCVRGAIELMVFLQLVQRFARGNLDKNTMLFCNLDGGRNYSPLLG